MVFSLVFCPLQVSDNCKDSSSIDDKADSVVVEINDFIKVCNFQFITVKLNTILVVRFTNKDNYAYDAAQVLGELSPSLSMDELKKYERLKEQFEGASK